MWLALGSDASLVVGCRSEGRNRQHAHCQTTNQKVVQKGGVISGRSACAAIDARVEAEAQKAGRATVRRYKQDVQRTATEASEPTTFQQLQWLDPILL